MSCFSQDELDAAKLASNTTGSGCAAPDDLNFELGSIRKINRAAQREFEDDEEDDEDEDEEDEDTWRDGEPAGGDGIASGTKRRRAGAGDASEPPAKRGRPRPRPNPKSVGPQVQRGAGGSPSPPSDTHTPDPTASNAMDADTSQSTQVEAPVRSTRRSGPASNAMDANMSQSTQVEATVRSTRPSGRREVSPEGMEYVTPVRSEFVDDEAESRATEVDLVRDDGPDWFQDVGPHFETAVAHLGPRWRKLVDIYTIMEGESGWMRSGQLPSNGRPDILDVWIKGGRLTRTSNMIALQLQDLPSFKRAFAVWYAGMQPTWRMSKGGKWERPKVGKRKRIGWELVEVNGVNGWLSVVACLYWWGMTTMGGGTQIDLDQWEEAVDDATWVMEGLTA